jgi:hypothetical protein
MHSGRLGGRIGDFRDPSTGQLVGGNVFGDFTFQLMGPGDPNNAQQYAASQLMIAIKTVIAQKLASNQIAIPTISHSMPHLQGEIIAAAGTQQAGIQIMSLNLQVQMDAPPQAAQPPMQMPPTPMQSMQNAFAQEARDRLDPSNYEVRAKINVGGFQLKASTDGGIDTDSLGEQAKDKVVSNLIWYGAGCFILLFVLGGVAAIVVYAFMGGGAVGSTKAGTWDGKTTFSCGGNDNVTIEGVTANIASGTAVNAGANCQLTLVNCNITAPTGINAGANAKVTVTGGSVTSSDTAAQALGNATITFSGTKVSGKKSALGAAKINGP